MLDEFSTVNIDKKSDAPTASGPGRPDATIYNEHITDDFAKQLQEQMASLMGDVDESPEMRQQIETMMEELTAAADADSHRVGGVQNAAESRAESNAPSGPEDAFQETIRRTMERMQASGEQATAAATSEDSDDILAQMLRDMQSGGLDGDGGDEDFSKMLMGMMEQLTNKEILYIPMKELNDKFPGWMSQNRERTNVDDLRRYEEQQRLVGEIVERFERMSYSDENSKDRQFIVERMQKVLRLSLSSMFGLTLFEMQAAGSPPLDLVGDMNAAQEALGDLESGCPQQ